MLAFISDLRTLARGISIASRVAGTSQDLLKPRLIICKTHRIYLIHWVMMPQVVKKWVT